MYKVTIKDIETKEEIKTVEYPKDNISNDLRIFIEDSIRLMDGKKEKTFNNSKIEINISKMPLFWDTIEEYNRSIETSKNLIELSEVNIDATKVEIECLLNKELRKDKIEEINKMFLNFEGIENTKIDDDRKLSLYIDCIFNIVSYPLHFYKEPEYNFLRDEIETELKTGKNALKNSIKLGYNKLGIYTRTIKYLGNYCIQRHNEVIIDEKGQLRRWNYELNELKEELKIKENKRDDNMTKTNHKTTISNVIITNETNINDNNSTSIGNIEDSIIDFSNMDDLYNDFIQSTNIKKPKRQKGQYKYTIIKPIGYNIKLSNYEEILSKIRIDYQKGKISKEAYRQNYNALRPYFRFEHLKRSNSYHWNENKPNKNFDYKNYLKFLRLDDFYSKGLINKTMLNAMKNELANDILINSTKNDIKWLSHQSNGKQHYKGWIKEEDNKISLYSFGNKVMELEKIGNYEILKVSTKTYNSNGFVKMDFINNKIIYPNLLSRGCKQHLKKWFARYDVFSNIKDGMSKKLDKILDIHSKEELENYQTDNSSNELIKIAIRDINKNIWFKLNNEGKPIKYSYY